MRDYTRNIRTKKLRVLAPLAEVEPEPVHLFLVMNGYPYPAAPRRHHVIVVASDAGQAKLMAAAVFARVEAERARRAGHEVIPDYSDPLGFDVVRLAGDVGQGGASEVWE